MFFKCTINFSSLQKKWGSFFDLKFSFFSPFFQTSIHNKSKIKKALRNPLDDDEEEFKQEKDDSAAATTSEHSILSYINKKSNKFDFSSKSIASLVTNEKYKIISDSSYKSASFKMFSKGNTKYFKKK